MSLSSNVAAKIAGIDAPFVASDPEKYIKANTFQYKVLINTWLGIVKDIRGPRQATALENHMRIHGLLSTISQCSDLANAIIQSNFTLSNLGDLGFLMVEDPRLSLQILRYPKRFSPLEADLLEREGIKTFAAKNLASRGEPCRIAYSKGWRRTSNGWKLETGPVLEWDIEYPDWLIDLVKSYVSKIYPTKRVRPFSPEELFKKGYFSSGTTAEGSKTLAEKVCSYSIVSPCFGHPMYPSMVKPGGIPDYIAVEAVPKSYKQPRIIGEVPAYFQYQLQGVRTYMEEARAKSIYRDSIILDDQAPNQLLAFIGSVQGTVATIDLSSASDSISSALARRCFSKIWFDSIEQNNPKYLLYPDATLARRWIWQTSGNATTFEGESGLFLAIALSAHETVERFTKVDDLIPPRVYGDDLECDVRVYDTLCDFLELLGFQVNKDKSFTVGSFYRESCGVEYWCGLDTSTKYWPRKAIGGKNENDYAALIQLQHRLFEFETSESYLYRLIVDDCKYRFHIDMTSSLPGTDCEDLWAIAPYFLKIYAPYDKQKGLPLNTPEEVYVREGHYALVSSYPRRISDSLKNSRDNRLGTLIGWEAQLHMYLYTQWLIHGPSFEGSGIHLNVGGDRVLLDEVIGVRTPKESIMRYLANGQMRWDIVPV